MLGSVHDDDVDALRGYANLLASAVDRLHVFQYWDEAGRDRARLENFLHDPAHWPGKRGSGGQLCLRSEPGQGTTVAIYLSRHVGETTSVDKLEVAADMLDATAGSALHVLSKPFAAPALKAGVQEIIRG